MQRKRNAARHFPEPFDWVLIGILCLIGIGYWFIAPAEAHAQSTLTFSAETTTGDELVVPVLTWSTSPAASACIASGDWSGEKGPSGMETLPAIDTGRTYNLACTWPGDSIATLTWVNPTTNTNGTPYTDGKETRIAYQLGAGPVTEVVHTPPTSTMRTITGLTSVGTYTFTARACNQRDVCSEPSNAASKTFTGMVTVDRSVGITVNPKPDPITALDAQ